jgi:hypothetical protein
MRYLTVHNQQILIALKYLRTGAHMVNSLGENLVSLVSTQTKKHTQEVIRLEAFSPKYEKNKVICYNLFGEAN